MSDRGRTRNRRAIAAVVLLAATLLPGCSALGDAATSASPPTPQPADQPAATPPASAAPAKVGSVTIGWAGDVVPASSDLGLPRDPSVLLGGVADLLKAPDVMFVNLEGNLTGRGASKCGSSSSNCFAFRSPPSYARVLRSAGIDVLNQANNHAYDFGSVGRADTVSVLDGVRLAHTGGPGEIAIVRRNGLRIAFVGFASYSWTAPLNSDAGVRKLVRAAAARADLVVVALHGGKEGAGAQHVPRGHEYYLGEDRGDLRHFARVAVEAGADLVVGSGPHVVRGIQFIHGRLVAYSTGNFVGYGRVFALSGPTSVSALLRVQLAADGRFLGGRIIPTILTSTGVAAPDPRGQAITSIRQLSRADFGSSAARIGRSGAIRPPR